mmetsp:Transcript_11245/g.69459  ORF Transcript_11245/g.69459 Transcript_11245/m.69459 type:complete len:85 (-) Transcript_11245:2351-2605(-)
MRGNAISQAGALVPPHHSLCESFPTGPCERSHRRRRVDAIAIGPWPPRTDFQSIVHANAKCCSKKDGVGASWNGSIVKQWRIQA